MRGPDQSTADARRLLLRKARNNLWCLGYQVGLRNLALSLGERSEDIRLPEPRPGRTSLPRSPPLKSECCRPPGASQPTCLLILGEWHQWVFLLIDLINECMPASAEDQIKSNGSRQGQVLLVAVRLHIEQT